MRDLIVRLEVVDDDAATALRVVAHFDGLAHQAASGPALMRAAAALAACPVGWHDTESGVTRRVEAGGRALPPAPWVRGWPRIALDPGRDGAVWLERSGTPGPLDLLILERLSLALGRTAPLVRDESVGHAVRVVCDADLTRSERQPALALLGLEDRVTVWAARLPADVRVARRQARIDEVTVVLLAPEDREPRPASTTATGRATGTTDRVPRILERARVALRFAEHPIDAGEPGHLDYDDLGVLAGLAEQVSARRAAEFADVARLELLSERHPWLPATLVAVVRHGSVRRAAVALHLHHSTLQDRLGWLERRLGFPLLDGDGRERLGLALALWRISRAG